MLDSQRIASKMKKIRYLNINDNGKPGIEDSNWLWKSSLAFGRMYESASELYMHISSADELGCCLKSISYCA